MQDSLLRLTLPRVEHLLALVDEGAHDTVFKSASFIDSPFQNVFDLGMFGC